MNLQLLPTESPLRLLVVNPLTPASKLAISEILVGNVFGPNRYIDLILLVYSNEIPLAEHFKTELRGCAFSTCNSIVVSSDLPSLTDADVFIFITNFPNPNKIDYNKLDTEEHFDTMYLISKIANNLTAYLGDKDIIEEETKAKQEKKNPEKKLHRPLIVADGMVTLYILKEVCKDLPADISLFCPTPVSGSVKSTLSEYLKIESTRFNKIHVWAADDEIFHFEVDKPLIFSNKSEHGCDSYHSGKELVAAKTLEELKFDYLQLSESWLKTDLLEKVVSNLAKNPYGCIFRASEIVRILQNIWKPRVTGEVVMSNLGTITNGSLGTIKGLPCVLPLIIEGENWKVNKHYERDPYLHHEIKRINKRMKEHNEKFVPYCKKFLEDNIIQQKFIPIEEDVTTMSVTTNNTGYDCK